MGALASCILTLAVAGCAASPPTPPPPPPLQKAAVPLPLGTAATCRFGPDGDPVVTDRGIGGTGIGGTGAPAARRMVDRGIGGTGVVGVITGFGSVCVDGLEIPYDPVLAVELDGGTVPADTLRVGQLAVIQTAGSETAPRAVSIAVRHEVAGPIEAVELGSGALIIAGQRVTVAPGTWGANSFSLGDWVAVSGLHQADGTIAASRLDAASPGTLYVHGSVAANSGVLRVGSLELSGPAAANARAGTAVTLSGHYDGRVAVVDTTVNDPLLSDPVAYFGANVSRIVLQAYVRVDGQAVWIGGIKVPGGPSLLRQSRLNGMAIVLLERAAGGAWSAVELRFTDYPQQTRRPPPSSGSPAGDAVSSLRSTNIPGLSRTDGPIASIALPAAAGGNALPAAVVATPPATTVPSAIVLPPVPTAADSIPVIVPAPTPAPSMAAPTQNTPPTTPVNTPPPATTSPPPTTPAGGQSAPSSTGGLLMSSNNTGAAAAVAPPSISLISAVSSGSNAASVSAAASLANAPPAIRALSVRTATTVLHPVTPPAAKSAVKASPKS